MKRTLLILWIFFPTLLWCQITVTAAIVPAIGDELIFELNTTPAVSIGAAGANQTWDFRSFTPQTSETVKIVSPSTAPHADAIPEVNFASELFGGATYLFSRKTNKGFFALGGFFADENNGNGTSIHYDLPQQEFAFPLSFGTTFSSTSAYTTEFSGDTPGSSFRVLRKEEFNSEVDAYGTVRLPSGDYPALRLKQTTTSLDSTFLVAGEIVQFFNTIESTSVSYEWLTNHLPGVLVSIDLDDAQNVLAMSVFDTQNSTFSRSNSGADAPMADFSFDMLSIGNFQFKDLSTNDPTSWAWDFGDGNTSKMQNPTHQYTEPGAYSVCLVAANADGADTICKELRLIGGPEPAVDFEIVDLGEARYSFIDRSANDPVSWIWNFGDGNESKEQNPTHTYEQEGNFTVTLRASNLFGTNPLSKMLSVVFRVPESRYNFEKIGDLTIQFIDNSTEGANRWRWDFGDGSSSREQNPQHTFSQAGTYTVCLIAINKFGSDTLCMDLNIGPVPESSFSVRNRGKGIFLFTDQSTNSPDSWFWDFGDGNTSSEQSPQHAYMQEGDYTVCLIAGSIYGSDTTCQLVRVADLRPTSGFSFSEVNQGLYQFTDISTNDPVEWFWDFGDGNTSTAQSPRHQYTEEGNYTACLIASNSFGTDTLCLTLLIDNLIPDAAFNVVATKTLGGFRFTDQTGNNPVDLFWDLGDGNTATGKRIDHIYLAEGDFTVCLVATNSFGADTLCQLVTVENVRPIPDFSFSDQGKGLVSFIDRSKNEPSSWFWDFGDGNTSSEASPTHQFTQEGDFTVCLIVSNIYGPDTICQIVTLSGLRPVANFEINLGTTGLIEFEDKSTNDPFAWFWEFGDGDTSTLQNPSHGYSQIGNYNICLTATNTFGDDRACKRLNILVTDLEELEKQLELKLFPNPFRDAFNLQRGTTNEPLWYSIYNAQGQLILKDRLQQQQFIDTQYWTPGVYLLQVRNSSGGILLDKLIHRQ